MEFNPNASSRNALPIFIGKNNEKIEIVKEC